jgi:uncharacterized protein (TIGR02001 family)
MYFPSSHSTLALLAFAVLPAFANAQTTANIALSSDYKFRGQDQDVLGHDGGAKTRALKPSLQGGLDHAFGDSGWYVGNWNASVGWLAGNSIESDLYGGYKFKADVFDIDLGALTYLYPGNHAGNTTELYAGASYTDATLGSVTLKYAHTVSKDYFNYAGSAAGSGLSGRNTGYLSLAYSKEIGAGVTLKAALGHTRMASDIRRLGYRSFVDYSLGASLDLGGGLSFGGALQGASHERAYALTSGPDAGWSPNRPRLVLTLAKTL